MARNLETIITELKEVYPTIKINDEILSTEEYNSTINSWAENELARQLDEEANGYKVARQSAYPALGEQFDKLWHDINNGTLDNTGEFFTALKEVKDNNPKPGA